MINAPVEYYRGIGWYRKSFTIDSMYKDKRIFLRFEAVGQVADVWINGNHLGRHRGGYTGFEFDITDHVFPGGRENVLAVRADNSNNRAIAPYNYKDFAGFPLAVGMPIYGGIYRDVWLVATGETRIESIFITTPEVSEDKANVQAKARVRNYGDSSSKCTLKIELFDKDNKPIVSEEATAVINAGKEYEYDIKTREVMKPSLWSPSNPYLYNVVSSVIVNGKVVDSIQTAAGFRWFGFKEYGPFYLNGKRLFLRGTNRHQDYEGYGAAISNDMHYRDMELIRDMGCNFVRLAHYPQDTAILDACDRLGLLVYEEIPVTICISTTTAYLENVKSQLTEMIHRDRNHPCMLFWGLGNESDQKLDDGSSEEYTNYFFNQLNDLAHKKDPARKTIVCNQRLESNTLITDVYSPQYWMGWYGSMFSPPGSMMARFGDPGEYGIALDERHRTHPYFMTGEYGAECVRGLHSEKPLPWDKSEEYACFMHEAYVKQGESRDWYIGHCFWLMFDHACPREDWKSPYYNRKGACDELRRKKDLYYFYQSYYTSAVDKPMVYIVSHTWTDRWKKPGKRNIWVYSNCDEVELYNDKGTISFGKRQRKPGMTRFKWERVKVKYNILYAEGRMNGVTVVSDTLELENLASPPERLTNIE